MRVHDADVERRAFAARFPEAAGLGVPGGEIVRLLAPALQRCFGDFAAALEAGPADLPRQQAVLAEQLAEAMKRPTFEAGLEVVGEPSASLASPSLRRLASLRQMGSLLSEFNSLRTQSPGMPAGKLLEQLAAEQRGRVLEGLLTAQAAGAEARPVFLVAGSSLVELDLSAEVPVLKVVDETPAAVGPLRSLNADAEAGLRAVLLGGRHGVVRGVAGELTAGQVFRLPEGRSPFGVNSALTLGGTLWATHADAGLLAWPLDDSTAPAKALPPAALLAEAEGVGGPRLLRAAAGRLVLAVGDAVLSVTDGRASPVAGLNDRGGEVRQILVADTTLSLVRSRGVVEVLDAADLSKLGEHVLGRDVTAAAPLPWLEGTRLLLGGDEGGLTCVGLEDSVVTRFAAGHRGLRDIAATGRHVVALSADRQRLVVWDAGQPGAPVVELNVAGEVRSRVADVAVLG